MEKLSAAELGSEPTLSTLRSVVLTREAEDLRRLTGPIQTENHTAHRPQGIPWMVRCVAQELSGLRAF